MQMKRPESFIKFFGVLNLSSLIVTIFYAGFGFLGFWKYGQMTADSISFNIPKNTMYDYTKTSLKIIYTIYPVLILFKKNLYFFSLGLLVRGLYATYVYLRFPLYTYEIMDLVWTSFIRDLVPDTEVPKSYMHMINAIVVLCACKFSFK